MNSLKVSIFCSYFIYNLSELLIVCRKPFYGQYIDKIFVKVLKFSLSTLKKFRKRWLAKEENFLFLDSNNSPKNHSKYQNKQNKLKLQTTFRKSGGSSNDGWKTVPWNYHTIKRNSFIDTNQEQQNEKRWKIFRDSFSYTELVVQQK